MLRRVKEVPGIQGAGITDALPLGRNRTWGTPAKGVVYQRGQVPSTFVRVVSDGYPAAMGIPLVAGRDIASTDRPDTEPVMLVNETMARNLWPGQDPIGKYVLGPCAKERRVVGVVGDVRHLALEQGSGNEMYLPLRQCGDQSSSDLVVRSSLPPAQLAGVVRAALAPIAPNLPGNDFRTLQQLVDKSVSPRRFMVLLLGGFAVFALVLASLGIYALISYSVSQRTQEIGIRMALGASASDVQRRIITQTLSLAAIGMVLGTAASWAMVQGAGSLLFGITPRDPATFVAMIGGPDDRGAHRRLPAGATRLAHRSDGGAPRGVELRLLGCSVARSFGSSGLGARGSGSGLGARGSEVRLSELPNYRTTELPNYRTTEPPNYRTTELPSYRATASPYTVFVFHAPRRNSTALTTASVEYATVSAMNTPRGPKPACTASHHASGISHSQKTPRLMSVGVHVSPAPLNDCVSTMPDGIEQEPEAHDAQAADRERQHRRIVGEESRDRPRRQQEHEPDAAEEDHVVERRRPHRALGAIGTLRPPGSAPPSSPRRC